MTDTSPNLFRAPEPPIAEMLADPLVRLLMKRDGVSREEVLRVLRSVNYARAAVIADRQALR